ncbi:MAG: hypothetical protein MUC42_03305 [Bryobacter sp.]|nr:hypothetical protein [Bryobacter sp.]
MAAILALTPRVSAQFRPQIFTPAAPTGGPGLTLNPNQRIRVPRPNAPAADEVVIRALRQEVEGPVRRLRGAAELETPDLLIQADEIDYNEETDYAEARGNVRYRNYDGGEQLEAERVEYFLGEQRGRFYEVKGSAPPKIQARQGVLTTTNPFLFQGEWAERIGTRYLLYNGFVTSCRFPRPWWVLTGPKFDIIPNDRAIGYQSMFRFKNIPIFFTPAFYKSLERLPRKSGFTTPNFGTSSRRGFMYGLGYYWAINRSYDLLYRTQYFTQRGFSHFAEFRGKPNAKSDFDGYVFGVDDKGRKLEDGTRVKEGGYLVSFNGLTEFGKWKARGTINYLSNFVFRQSFTETLTEAIFSEVNSIGAVSRHWSSFGLHIAYARTENFIFGTRLPDGSFAGANDKIVLQRLPSLEFTSRDRRLKKDLPIWVSFNTSAGLVQRTEPQFRGREFTERVDAAPRIGTRLRWKDFTLLPGFTFHGTYYGAQQQNREFSDRALFRKSVEGDIDLIFPSFSRIYRPTRRWMGEKLKHVIEPRVRFLALKGIGEDYLRVIRFDDMELLTDTTELEVSITNRFYSKNQYGAVTEWLNWRVAQKKYFDADFGGTVLPFRRNVIQSSAEFSAFSFLNGPRNYSPVTNAIRAFPTPGFSVEWAFDVDPLRGGVTNSSVTADGRVSNFFLSLGHVQVRSDRLLTPNTNQFRGLVGLGRENKRGWNAGFFWVYDYRIGTLQFANTQVTYNTDCCGFTVQHRVFNFGTRQENQVRFAFSVANLGSVGTLRRLERFF